MQNLLWLLSVVSSLQCVTAQISLVESGPGTVKPSETLELTCKVTGASLTDSINMYAVFWIFQQEGKGLVYLGYINYVAGTNYNPSVQGRLTLSRDTNKGEVHFKLTGVKSEESGKYYSARWYNWGGHNAMDIWGQGTMVTVTSDNPSPGTLLPLLPCCDIVSGNPSFTIGCLLRDTIPIDKKIIKWNDVEDNRARLLTTIGKGISAVTSFMTISSSDWEKKKFTCSVGDMKKSLNEECEIKKIDLKKTPPTVEVMQSSCGESGSVDLVCLISNYTPSEISIQWLLNGQLTSISPTNTTPYKDDDGNFGSSSRVSVPKEDWITGDVYTCRVNHPATSSKNEDIIRKCPESGTHPKVVLLPPSPKDIHVTKELKLTCVVSQMDSPSSLIIKWRRSDGKKTTPYTPEPEQQNDGTYKSTSTLRINLSDWNSQKSFTCIVQHEEFPIPVEKTIQKREEEGTDPVIYIYPPTPDELQFNDFVTLICLLKHFNPKDIYVQWKRNNVVQGEDYYINTEPMQDEDEENYFMYSRLIIEKSDWNRGSTYTCIGVHKNITSKDIKKSRGK